MQDIQDMVMKNYQDNMEYFKQNHLSLHAKLSALEHILNTGQYPQKYELDYKDGYFDIIELSSNTYLYNKDSELFSKELTNQINFQKEQQSFKSSYDLTFTSPALEKIKDGDALMMYATTAHIIDYHNNFTSTSMSLERVHKFIFIGIGLGLHISSIIKKIGADSILFIEDDIELFRLSMFTCNYKNILKNKHAFFSIAQNKVEFLPIFTEFYHDLFIQNLYLKFSLFSSKYEQKIKEIQTLIVSRPETTYSVERLLYKNTKVLQRLTQNYKFLDVSKKIDEAFFKNKPIIVIGAGPSLHVEINWLKENEDKFIIIAVFAALKTLKKYNITPDVVIQIDEKVTETINLLKNFDNFDFLKESIFIFSPSVPDILFEIFSKTDIYLIEDRTHYKQNNTFLASYSVGEVAYAISLAFNADNIYLLGLDLALSDDGNTHAKDHHLGNKLNTSTIDKVQKSVSIIDSVLYVQGNFRDVVVTTPVLSLSINLLNDYTRELKTKNQNIYNLNDGAFFEETVALRSKEYLGDILVDKEGLKAELTKFFDNYASCELSYEELKSLNIKLSEIDSYCSFIDTFIGSASSNKSLFIESYKKLIMSLTISNNSELNDIINMHLLKTAPYIIDLFNTKEIQNHKKHTKKIKKLLIMQLEKIIQLYKKSLLDSMH